MQNRTNLFIAISSVLLFNACSNQANTDIKKAEWLIGTWECKTLEGKSYESWSKATEQEYVGKSYMLNEKDTVVFERIRLVQEGDGLFYIPTVMDQNGGQPVRFAKKMVSDTQLVFENPQHDFPQMISYTQIGSDSLIAEISGTINGQEQKQSFPMKRVK